MSGPGAAASGSGGAGPPPPVPEPDFGPGLYEDLHKKAKGHPPLPGLAFLH